MKLIYTQNVNIIVKRYEKYTILIPQEVKLFDLSNIIVSIYTEIKNEVYYFQEQEYLHHQEIKEQSVFVFLSHIQRFETNIWLLNDQSVNIVIEYYF